MLKIVYLSLAVLNLYRCCNKSTGLATCFNLKVKNLVFDTSKVITNAWFSMKNYALTMPRNSRVLRMCRPVSGPDTGLFEFVLHVCAYLTFHLRTSFSNN